MRRDDRKRSSEMSGSVTNTRQASDSYHVAVIGSGPAGFYVAEALLNSEPNVCIDMFERLPVPFGLVRHGVAPDHQKLKAVTAVFEKVAMHPDFRFYGNVELGRDIEVAELLNTYDAVVVATGASSDRPLGIEGENLAGSVSATEFVGWYNGHPDFRDRTFDLSHPTAVIVGNGNVALDVCRILAKSVDELKQSDICSHALEVLSESRITEIVLVGRRGPVQSKFTHKELREFGGLAVSEPTIDPDDLRLGAASELELMESASAANNLRIFRSFRSARDERSKPRRIDFRFQLAPLRIMGAQHVEGVVFSRMELVGPAFQQEAVMTGANVSIPAGLIVRSAGYRGVPIPGVPFDKKSATIPHVDGRVCGEDGVPVARLYVAGWIKRGPSGVIGTNRACGVDTCAAVLSDLLRREMVPACIVSARRERISSMLRARSIVPVDFEGWRKIDVLERDIGAARGKPREKLTNVPSMLAAAAPAASRSALAR